MGEISHGFYKKIERMALRISHSVYPDNWSGNDFNQWVNDIHQSIRSEQKGISFLERFRAEKIKQKITFTIKKA